MSSLRRETFMYSQFSGTANWSLYPLKLWYQLLPRGAEDSHLLKHHLQMLLFSYSDVTMTQVLIKKFRNFLMSISILI